jgi:hypothetical protein
MKTLACSIAITFCWICGGFSPRVEAVNPPPDGGYPGGNTAEGQSALLNLTTGTYNTAVGFLSLANNTNNNFNTAIGSGALFANTVGFENTAIGAGAMLSNTAGIGNSAVGTFALINNVSGVDNTATGQYALLSNTSGDSNTAIGSYTLQLNIDGFSNTAVGFYALNANNGMDNTAVGVEALLTTTTGSYNTAVGTLALGNSTAGTNNIALGYLAGWSVITANNVICIGHPGGDVSNSCFISYIRDVQTQNSDAVPVVIDSAGQLGTVSSSRRFKKEIRPMDKASEALLELKPVTFHYKTDTKSTPQFGLIAEEVAKVDPDLVVHDRNGEIYSVRYDQVNAMLLNEFLKEHRTVQDLKATVAEQQKQIEALTRSLQKVSAQLEVSKPVPQTAMNSR